MLSHRLTKGNLILMLLLSAGCAGYRVTVQGVVLDHFIQSQTASSPAAEDKREAVYHNDLGVMLERDGDLEGALMQYRMAQRQDPDLVLAYINAGNVNVKLGRLTTAENLYRKALKLNPDQTLALNNLAWIFIIQDKNLNEAITLLETAIESDRENRYRYLDSLGWALYRKGRLEDGIETLHSAVTETPPEERYLLGEAHYHLGLIYHDQGKSELAEKHLRKSLEISPSPEREREIEEMR